MPGPESAIVHASALTLRGAGVLVRGVSGAGKSSLVLAILHAEGAAARLVADDRVVLLRRGEEVVARPPREIAGLIEIRGQGIVRVPHAGEATVALVVDLAPVAECPRYPDGDERFADILGVRLPRIWLAAGAEGTAGGPARVAFALGGGVIHGDDTVAMPYALIRSADR